MADTNKAYIQALQDFTSSLQNVVDTLAENAKKEDDTAAVMEQFFGKNSEWFKLAEDISEDVKSVKDTGKKNLTATQKILQEVKAIRKSKETGLFDRIADPDNKKGLVDGIKSVTMIAGAVLAIGLAFKVVGDVDWASVLALSVAMPLIAYAIAQISEIKNLTPKNLLMMSLALAAGSAAMVASSYILSHVELVSLAQFATMIGISATFVVLSYGMAGLVKAMEGVKYKDLMMLPLTMVTVATAIALSSHIFQLISPITLPQFLTAVGITAVFTVISYGLAHLVRATKDISPKNLLMLPLTMVTVATSIALSSHILQYISPINVAQFLTAIAISAMFVVVSFGLSMLVDSIKDVKPKDLLMLPVTMIAISTALMVSSQILQFVTPITMAQFLTSLGIAAVFAVVGFGISLLTQSVKNMKPKDILMLPVTLAAISTGIMVSSFILSMVQPIPFMDVLMASTALAVAALALAIPIYIVSKVGLENIAKGSLGVVAIAGAIMVSSWLLGQGSYGAYPTIEWSLAVGLSMLIFLPAALIAGKFISQLIPGAIGVAIVAATIMVSSLILSVGSYDSYPTLDWSMGVGLSLLAFVPAMLIMGNPAMILAAVFGAISMAIVAGTIVATSYILGAGDYGVYPTVDWITGVGLSLLAFVPAILFLSNPFLLLMLPLGMLSLMMVAQSIVDVAELLNGGDFSGGPTKEWAEGVGLSLIYFSEALAMATPSVWDWLMGSDLDSQIEGLHNVVDAMVDIAQYLSDNSAPFKNGPPKEWAEGVGLAIKYFSEAMANTDQSVWDWLVGNTIDDKIAGMRKTIDAMVDIAGYLSEKDAVFEGGPSKDWAEGTGKAIVSFSEAMVHLDEVDPEDTQEYIMYVVDAMVAAAAALNTVDFSKPVDKKWLSGFDKMVGSFIKAGDNYDEIEDGVDILTYMAEEAGYIIEGLEEAFSGRSSLYGYASGIKAMGDAYALLAKSISNLNQELAEMQEKSISTLQAVSATVLALSLSDSSNLQSVLEENTEALVDMFKQISESQAEVQKNKSASMPQRTPAPQVKKEDPKHVEAQKQTSLLEQIKKELTTMNGNISKMVGNTEEMVDLMSTNKKKDVGIKTK